MKHVVHCHKSVVSHALQDSESTCTMNNDSSNNSNDETVPVASDSSCTCGSEPMVTEKCTNVDQVFANIEHHCASFVLGLREKHMIPSVVQDEVVSSVKHLLSQALVDYRDVISSELQNGAPGYTMSAQLFSVLDIERHCDFCDSGITHSVIWNETDGFHVTKNWEFDVMHDMLEGVCDYDMHNVTVSTSLLLCTCCMLEFRHLTMDWTRVLAT